MVDATALKRRINGQTAEIERLREALRYYAEDAHYDSGDVPGHVYVLDDHGDTARVALGLPPRHKHPPSVAEQERTAALARSYADEWAREGP